MSHILMGAINKSTERYEYPKIAEKTNNYSCPDCKKDVILRKGNIRVHHFAHFKSDNPCVYYERPGESQIHKDAKLALKTVLESGKDIHFLRSCSACNKYNTHIIENGNATVQIEYPFMFNNSRKIADIACIEGDSIKYIFEICYRHKTCVNARPEPWFEINAERLLYVINNRELSDTLIQVECIREHKCNSCTTREKEEKEKQRIIDEEEKEKQRIIDGEEKEKQRILLEKYKEEERKWLKKCEEQQRIKEEEEKRYKKLVEIRKEIKTKIWSEHKRCSKCKSYERCKKCVDKLYKKCNSALNERLQPSTTENPQTSES